VRINIENLITLEFGFLNIHSKESNMVYRN
jgi:uncharacterized membrane protein